MSMFEAPYHEYRLPVGEAVIALSGQGEEFVPSLEAYFGQVSAERPPDVRLRLEVHETAAPREVPSSLYAGKRRRGDDGFEAGGGIVRGRYDPDRGEAVLQLESVLLAGRCVRIFEQLLYQAYQSAVRRGVRGGIMLHAAGVVRDGAGYAFVGASEAGKSTLAGLCRDHEVLNDEIVLIGPYPGDAPQLVSTPFNGFFTGKAVGSAPLRAVFLLEQGEQPAVRRLGAAETAATLTAQVVPPVSLEGFLTDRTAVEMLDRARWIAERVPVAVLRFRKAPDFWPVIDAFLADAKDEDLA